MLPLFSECPSIRHGISVKVNRRLAYDRINDMYVFLSCRYKHREGHITTVHVCCSLITYRCQQLVNLIRAQVWRSPTPCAKMSRTCKHFHVSRPESGLVWRSPPRMIQRLKSACSLKAREDREPCQIRLDCPFCPFEYEVQCTRYT